MTKEELIGGIVGFSIPTALLLMALTGQSIVYQLIFVCIVGWSLFYIVIREMRKEG